MDEPSVDLLATAAGTAGVVFLVTSVLRTVIPAAVFDRWGAALAVLVGIGLAVLYAVTRPDGFTSDDVLQALLVGLFAGGFSQNINTVVRRALGPG